MTVYIEILGFLLLTLQICSTQLNCPKTTECIKLKKCPPLFQLLDSKNDSLKMQYLRDQHCGFEDSDPLVCCPLDRNETSTSTSTMKPPTEEVTLKRSSLLPYSDCGHDLTPKIIGGNKTDINEFPWIALLEYQEDGHIKLACGGSLINNRYVLTAGHCITSNLNGVRLGEYDTISDQDCVQDGDHSFKCSDPIVRVGIEEIIVHSGYVSKSLNQFNDIALLRLDRYIEFSDFIRPICLPEKPISSKNFVAAGWGKTESRSESNIKLKVFLPLVGLDPCQKAYNGASRTITENQMCAGGQKDKDTCSGDSGGPLMAPETNQDGINRWTCAGVVSYGHKFCGSVGWPGVYTKVSTYMPWINSVLKP